LYNDLSNRWLEMVRILRQPVFDKALGRRHDNKKGSVSAAFSGWSAR